MTALKDMWYDFRFKIGLWLFSSAYDPCGVGLKNLSFPVKVTPEVGDFPNMFVRSRGRFVWLHEDWLKENCEGPYRMSLDPDSGVIFFSRPSDAVKFKLMQSW